MISTEEYTSSVETAERQIRAGDYEEAKDALLSLQTDMPTDGRGSFNLGNIALLTEDYVTAKTLYSNAIKLGYKNSDIYYNAGIAAEKMGDKTAAEDLYHQAVEAADEERKKVIRTAVFAFYIREQQFMNAKRMASVLVRECPDLYDGHHLYVCACIYETSFEEAETYLEEYKNAFLHSGQFWVDYLAIKESLGKYGEIIRLINNEQEVLNHIPELALREKIHCLLLRRNTEAVKQSIMELYNRFPQNDVALAVLVTAMIDGKYLDAGNIATAIMQKEKEHPNYIYFLALYLGIFAIYMAADKKMTSEMIDFSVNGLTTCKMWFEAQGIKSAELNYMITFFIALKGEN